VPLRFVFIDNAAALSCSDAHYQVEFVFLGQVTPLIDDIPVILRGRGQPGAVVDTLMSNAALVKLNAVSEA
jgi:hypothetical protein